MTSRSNKRILDFEYPEDAQFFATILSRGDIDIFIQKYSDYFDFRDPVLKRKEFNNIRNQVFKELVLKNGLRCQIKAHSDCSKIKIFNVDHYIPLSSNELNKKIRKIKSLPGKKVRSQSFGSNDLKNLRLVCGRCNAFKKHRITGFLSSSVL